MNRRQQFIAIIVHEGNGYVATCPEFDVASQGETVEEARDNVIEAIALLLETADPSEIESRLDNEVFVTQVGVLVG